MKSLIPLYLPPNAHYNWEHLIWLALSAHTIYQNPITPPCWGGISFIHWSYSSSLICTVNVYSVILTRVIFVLLHMQTISPCLEFTQTQLSLKRYNMRHWKSPSFKITCWKGANISGMGGMYTVFVHVYILHCFNNPSHQTHTHTPQTMPLPHRHDSP